MSVWAVVAIPLSIVWFVLLNELFTTLRSRHPGIFSSIGSPSLILNNSISNNLATFRFILSSRALETDDKRLIQLVKRLRIAFALVFIWFFLPLSALFLYAVPVTIFAAFRDGIG